MIYVPGSLTSFKYNTANESVWLEYIFIYIHLYTNIFMMINDDGNNKWW